MKTPPLPHLNVQYQVPHSINTSRHHSLSVVSSRGYVFYIVQTMTTLLSRSLSLSLSCTNRRLHVILLHGSSNEHLFFFCFQETKIINKRRKAIYFPAYLPSWSLFLSASNANVLQRPQTCKFVEMSDIWLALRISVPSPLCDALCSSPRIYVEIVREPPVKLRAPCVQT